jgi:type II secretory pathway component PulF
MSSAYRYRAARADGGIVSGYLEAASPAQASTTLREDGLHLLVLTEAEPGSGRRPAAPREELAAFFRCLASLVAAGVPIERALAAAERLVRGSLAETAGAAQRLLREGRSLAESLEAGRGVVPGVVLGILKGGERGSQLEAALESAAQHLEYEAELAGRLKQALAYPIVIATAGTISVIVIATIVVPRFAAILSDLGQELPLATRWLLAASSFVAHQGIWLAASAAAVVIGVRDWWRRPSGQRRMQHWLLTLPVVGRLRHLLAGARLLRAVGGMLQAGMPLLSALDSASDAGGDLALADRLRRARQRVAQGEPLTGAFEREAVLPPLLLPLLSVGEGSGRLAPMMLRAADVAAREGARALRTLIGLLEPGLVVFFGGLVAFVAAALLQAVYSLRPGGP